MKRILLTATALICLSGPSIAQMPIVSGLKTVPAQHGLKVASAPASTPTAPAPPSARHDCGIFVMGAGGNFFASALRHQAENFRRANPKAKLVEMRRHQDTRDAPAFCKNPLWVGHSMGALRVAKTARRGRVISIDPPNWHPPVRVRVPAINFFHCPPSPFGCGRILGGQNVDLTKERRGHVRLPYSPRITQEVTR